MKPTLIALLAASALAAAACNNGSSTSAISTAPTNAAITENFSGTVPVGGSDSHPFTVVQSGGMITLDLLTAGPPATIFMGFGIGAWDGTTCTLANGGTTNAQAGLTPQLSGTINAGNYCVMVYDIGNQSAPITYNVTVVHY